jgi:two-component system response regulator RegX3
VLELAVRSQPVETGRARVLLGAPESQLRARLVAALAAEAFVVDAEDRGDAVLDGVAARPPDLVVLTVDLAGLSGVEVCRRLRATTTVPVVLVATSDAECLAGLEAGADAVVDRPERVREFVARLRAVLRRAGTDHRRRPTPGEAAAPHALSAGGVRLDPAGHRVWVRGVEIHLPPKEFTLLELLMANAGQVLTRGLLLNRVWGPEVQGSSTTLEVHIKRLRSRIEEHPGRPRLITTVRGLGYRFQRLAEPD